MVRIKCGSGMDYESHYLRTFQLVLTLRHTFEEFFHTRIQQSVWYGTNGLVKVLGRHASSKPSLLSIGILFKSFHTNMALLAIGSKTHMGILFKSFHSNEALATYWVQDPCLVPMWYQRPMVQEKGVSTQTLSQFEVPYLSS